MCGIVGAYSITGANVVPDVFWALKDLEHRGQEGCGLACPIEDTLVVKRAFGSVDNLRAQIEGIVSPIAVGHTRYSTTGSSSAFENLQPIVPAHHRSALVHNGNLVNPKFLRNHLAEAGVCTSFYGTSDSGLISAYIHDEGEGIRDKIRRALSKSYFIGAYSLLISTRTKLIAVRDPWGIRPLSLGVADNHFIVASETCAFRESSANYIDDIKPGEMVVFTGDELIREQVVEPRKQSFCIFEAIYFARPDSFLYGNQVADIRCKLGHKAADEFAKKFSRDDFDIISPVPDSGTQAALGFASGINASDKFNFAFLKVRGQRTFINPDSTIRRRGVREKLSPITSHVKDKRVVIVDDSIVRGNTSREIVSILRKAGALEVHLVIPSPPIVSPCYYGIDMVSKAELIAANYSVDEIRQFLGADSLTYISAEQMNAAIPFSADCCKACFNSCYPVPIMEDVSKDCLE